MSLDLVLANALSGLTVAQKALAVTSNNVANANTEGYSRQVAQQASVVVGGVGAGARSTETKRMVDDLLTARLREQAGRVGRSGTLSGFEDQLQERLFGAPGDTDRGIANRIAAVASAAATLAGGPDQAGLAADFVGKAQDLAAAIASAGAEVQSLRRDADAQISTTVTAINGSLRQLDQINQSLRRDGTTPEILDQRDGLLADLAQKLDLSTATDQDGAVSVYTRSGLALLDGGLHQLVYQPAATVGAGTVFGPVAVYAAQDLDPATGLPVAGASGRTLITGGVRADLTPELVADPVADAAQRIVSPLQGGTLQGLLEARDRLLPGIADQLGEIAGTAAQVLNATHNAAVPYPPPALLSGTRTDTAAFAAAARSGTGYLAVVDRNTGAVAAVVPVYMAGAADPTALAGQINAGLGAFGSAALAADGSLRVAAAAGYGIALNEGNSSVTATDAAGHSRTMGFAQYFGLNDLLVADGGDPSRLTVRDDIAADPGLLARAQLDVRSGPPLAASLGGSGDNRGAQALAAAFDAEVDTVARGDLPAGRHRLADLAAEMVSIRAGAADRAKSDAANDQALADDLKSRQAATSGVNLDEELSRLVLYQQAYSVAARLISVTDELFGQLLAIGK